MTQVRHSIAEAAGLTGIPAQEIHARIWRGDLPGDGNIAMPGNTSSGFINAETLALLEREARAARASRHTAVPDVPQTRNLYMAMPLAHVALELQVPVGEVERLLVVGELEGPVLNHRYTGVSYASLAAYQERLRATVPTVAPEIALPAVQDPGPQGTPVPTPVAGLVRRFRRVLTGIHRAI